VKLSFLGGEEELTVSKHLMKDNTIGAVVSVKTYGQVNGKVKMHQTLANWRVTQLPFFPKPGA